MKPETSTPVMDVSAPVAPPTIQEPALAVAPPEAKTEHESKPVDESKPETKDKAKAKVESKVIQPQKSNGVTAAIVATVFIVFGLAALATYAYLKQNT